MPSRINNAVGALCIAIAASGGVAIAYSVDSDKASAPPDPTGGAACPAGQVFEVRIAEILPDRVVGKAAEPTSEAALMRARSEPGNPISRIPENARWTKTEIPTPSDGYERAKHEMRDDNGRLKAVVKTIRGKGGWAVTEEAVCSPSPDTTTLAPDPEDEVADN